MCSHRRYDELLIRFNFKPHRNSDLLEAASLSSFKPLEYTTEQIRQELAAREARVFASLDTKQEENTPSAESDGQTAESTVHDEDNATVEVVDSVQELECREIKKPTVTIAGDEIAANPKEVETKSKKKRRKKSMMKKKASAAIVSAAQNAVGPTTTSINVAATVNRKNSLSSSGGSTSAGQCDQNDIDAESNQQSSNATMASIDDLGKAELAVTANDSLNDSNSMAEAMDTSRNCDLHFFSDTEVATSPYGSRPSTPIQSDSEFEVKNNRKLLCISFEFSNALLSLSDLTA